MDPSAPVPDDLVQADTFDFLPGNELWRFDYPHVYWHLTDDSSVLESSAAGRDGPIELHRSFSCTPEIFQVSAARKRNAEINKREMEEKGQINETSDEDEHTEEEMGEQHALQQQQQQHDASVSSDSLVPSASSPSSGSDALARNSLLGMFSHRAPKLVRRGIHSAPLELLGDVRMPQGVTLESCSHASFEIPNKVSSILLMDCNNVELHFTATVGSVELLRCQSCVVRCLVSCPSWQLDDSPHNRIEFPGTLTQAMWVTTGSNGTQITAKCEEKENTMTTAEQEQDEKEIYHIDREQTFVIDEEKAEQEHRQATAAAAAEAADSADSEVASPPASASSSAAKQFKTLWNRGVFSMHVLEREGPLGYFDCRTPSATQQQ